MSILSFILSLASLTALSLTFCLACSLKTSAICKEIALSRCCSADGPELGTSPFAQFSILVKASLVLAALAGNNLLTAFDISRMLGLIVLPAVSYSCLALSATSSAKSATCPYPSGNAFLATLCNVAGLIALTAPLATPVTILVTGVLSSLGGGASKSGISKSKSLDPDCALAKPKSFFLPKPSIIRTFQYFK